MSERQLVSLCEENSALKRNDLKQVEYRPVGHGTATSTTLLQGITYSSLGTDS